MSVNNPICPQGCSSILPEVSFDECVPSVSFGEIEHIYVASGDADPFIDWTQLIEWVSRLSDSAIDPDAIRKLDVSADLPASTKNTIDISLARKISAPGSWVINVDIDDITDQTYDFMRVTECNVQFRFWFATGEKLFGGNDGILGMFNLSPVIERGAKTVNKLSGTITWENQFAPERCDSPFAS